MSDVRAIGSITLIGLVCAAIVAGTNHFTQDRITANHLNRHRSVLSDLIGNGELSPGVLNWIGSSEQGVLDLCNGRTIMRARQPGYAGDIQMLVAMTTDERARVSGLRVTRHSETPGIADFLNSANTGWLQSLDNHTASSLSEVDTVSGATITSRAVLDLLQDSLASASESDSDSDGEKKDCAS